MGTGGGVARSRSSTVDRLPRWNQLGVCTAPTTELGIEARGSGLSPEPGSGCGLAPLTFALTLRASTCAAVYCSMQSVPCLWRGPLISGTRTTVRRRVARDARVGKADGNKTRTVLCLLRAWCAYVGRGEGGLLSIYEATLLARGESVVLTSRSGSVLDAIHTRSYEC